MQAAGGGQARRQWLGAVYVGSNKDLSRWTTAISGAHG